MNSVRHNWAAIVVATLVYFMLGGVWFTVLRTPWMAGLGRTLEDLTKAAYSPAITYG